MPIDGWRSLRLGDFVTLQRGHDLPIQLRRPGNVPILGSFGVTGTHDEAKAKGPGVTVGRSGASFGVVSYCPTDYWPLNTALYVVDFHGNDERFAYYFLRSIDFSRFNSGSAQPSLNRNFIHPIPIEVPSFREQRSIAELLGSIDDKIDLNRRMNETLEAMARAIFKSWFVDFDPVRAKMEGRQPVGMDADAAALFPDTLDDSPGASIPSGWIETALKDEIELLTGLAFKSERFVETPPGVRLARGDNVKEGFFEWGTKSRFWPEMAPELERYLLNVGDVLIGMDGSKVGKNWVRVRDTDLPCLLVQRVARLRARASVGEHFIALLVSDQRFMGFVNSVRTGTSIPHISSNQILTYPFHRPPRGDDRLFHRLEQMVDPLARRQDSNVREMNTLASLRDLLLPKLLSGEIRVKDADTALGTLA